MIKDRGATIRAYRDDLDRDRLAEIWLAASRVGHPFLSETELLDQQAKVRNTYLPQAENWVVEDNGSQVGFIGLIDNFIGGLFVDPTAHGSGHGKALVLYAATLKGTLDLEVYAANVAAIGFYRRLGFLEVSRSQRDVVAAPFDDDAAAFVVIVTTHGATARRTFAEDGAAPTIDPDGT